MLRRGSWNGIITRVNNLCTSILQDASLGNRRQTDKKNGLTMSLSRLEAPSTHWHTTETHEGSWSAAQWTYTHIQMIMMYLYIKMYLKKIKYICIRKLFVNWGSIWKDLMVRVIQRFLKITHPPPTVSFKSFHA